MKKLLQKKQFSKEDKIKSVLFGLIELYIKTNQPIGSNTLKESGFQDISSATIRNYFAKLEEEGYLTQQHISGGRAPTAKAYKEYALSLLEKVASEKKEQKALEKELKNDGRKVAEYLNSSLEFLANLTNLSIFQSSPRFDQDFISNLKLMLLDKNKTLCVIITDFGLIKTEILYSTKDLDEEMILSIEEVLLWRMNKAQKPKIEDQSIMKLAQHFYNELMVRYIVGYTNFDSDDIYKTGLSKLLSFKEFQDPMLLAEVLSIFENSCQMHMILQEAMKKKGISFYIADDLEKFKSDVKNVSIITIPYYISKTPVGAIAILCPINANYKKLFSIIKSYSDILSENLTKMVYKYKITYRQSTDYKQVTKSSILLEDKTKN
ncbi:MAG: heat-inducible transcriptional repressor HrcA [Parachlamydiales bacterium]|nr:heat-inducible transcriptional repressor HrcA [Parachlamydiales bacterium]